MDLETSDDTNADDQALAYVLGNFSDDELDLIAVATNSSAWGEFSVQSLWMDMSDAIDFSRLDLYWNVDGQVLVSKLRGLREAETAVLVRLVQAFWARTELKHVSEAALSRQL